MRLIIVLLHSTIGRSMLLVCADDCITPKPFPPPQPTNLVTPPISLVYVEQLFSTHITNLPSWICASMSLGRTFYFVFNYNSTCLKLWEKTGRPCLCGRIEMYHMKALRFDAFPIWAYTSTLHIVHIVRSHVRQQQGKAAYVNAGKQTGLSVHTERPSM